MPELIDTGSSGRGASYYGRWMHCPQDWAYTYRAPETEKAPESMKALPLRKGSVLGVGLAHYYAEMLDRDVYEPIVAMKMVGEKLEVDTSTMADLLVIFNEYRKKYQYETWKPVAVERLVEGKLDGEPYTMRLDLEVTDERGRHLIVDHKSSSRVSSDLTTRYTLSGQFVGAYLAGRKLGALFGGIVINAVPSVLSNLKFMRLPLPPAPNVQSVAAYARTIKYAAEGIRKYEGTPYDQYPKALSETACVTQYGICPHFERCRMGG